MRKFLCSVLCLILCGVGLSETKEELTKPRIWTATSGHKVLGTFVQIKDNNFTFKTGDGTLKTISLDKLSEDDQVFLRSNGELNQNEEAHKKAGITLFFRNIEKVKEEGGLDLEEGFKFYSDALKDLLNYIPDFKVPKDFLTESRSINEKYMVNEIPKEVPIDKRKNLLTGELIETVQGEGEPQWQKVTQYMKFEKPYRLMLVDILETDKVEKRCVVVFYINPSTNSFNASYAESFDNKYGFRVGLRFKKINDDDKYGGVIGSEYSPGFNWFVCNDKKKTHVFEVYMGKMGEFPVMDGSRCCSFGMSSKEKKLNDLFMQENFFLGMLFDKVFNSYAFQNKKFLKLPIAKDKAVKNPNREKSLLEVFKNDN